MKARIGKLVVVALLAVVPITIPAQSPGDDEPRYSRKGADTCLSCHADAVTMAIFSTAHAVPADSRSPFGRGQLQCEACHGPGDAHSGRVRRGEERPPLIYFNDSDNTAVDVENGMCSNCHSGDMGIGWHAGPHGANDVGCADCHQSHTRLDAVQQTSTQADVCADCHQLQRNETRKAFAHPIAEEKLACTDCHGMHDDIVASELARATLNDTCYRCHAEKRGPYLWEHAPVAEDCGLCHAAHGSNHPGMLTRRAPLMCQGCHSQDGHPAVAYDTGGLASSTPSRYLLAQGCMNCHSQVHGSNHPSGSKLTR